MEVEIDYTISFFGWLVDVRLNSRLCLKFIDSLEWTALDFFHLAVLLFWSPYFLDTFMHLGFVGTLFQLICKDFYLL